jgi:hypothetical protein
MSKSFSSESPFFGPVLVTPSVHLCVALFRSGNFFRDLRRAPTFFPFRLRGQNKTHVQRSMIAAAETSRNARVLSFLVKSGRLRKEELRVEWSIRVSPDHLLLKRTPNKLSSACLHGHHAHAAAGLAFGTHAAGVEYQSAEQGISGRRALWPAGGAAGRSRGNLSWRIKLSMAPTLRSADDDLSAHRYVSDMDETSIHHLIL